MPTVAPPFPSLAPACGSAVRAAVSPLLSNRKCWGKALSLRWSTAGSISLLVVATETMETGLFIRIISLNPHHYPRGDLTNKETKNQSS